MQSELDTIGVFLDYSCVRRGPVFPEEIALKGRSTEIKPDWSHWTLRSPSCNKNSHLQFPLLKRFVNSVHSETWTWNWNCFIFDLQMTTKDSYFISVSSGTTAATGSFRSAAKTRWDFTTWTGLCVILFYVLSEEKIFTVLVIFMWREEALLFCHQPQCWSFQHYRWKWAADVLPLILLNMCIFMVFFFFFPALVFDWAFRVEEVIAVLWGWINELSTLSDRKIIALSVSFANQSVPPFSHDFRFEHWELMVPEKRWLFLSCHGARGVMDVLIFFLRFFVLSLLSERYLCLLSVFDAEDVIQPKWRLTFLIAT